MTRNQNTHLVKRVLPVLDRKKLHQISLSGECKAIIYGTLLGDGCLQTTKKGSNNARLSIRHSSAQAEYFDWKASHLKEIASPKSVQIQIPGFRANNKLLFQSRALEQLTAIMSITHHTNRLHIQRRWLNHFSALSLAIWWCDNGSIIANGRKGVLCTDGFDEASVRLLADYLQTVWGIYVHVGAQRRKSGNASKPYYRLWFGTEQLKRWLRIIMPYIPVPSMIPKVLLVYKHSLFQQRWISEIKSALPQFDNQIDECAKQRCALRSENDIVHE